MPGLTQLNDMLMTLSPELDSVRYVFATVPSGAPTETLNPLCLFREAEGDTLILTQQQAMLSGFDCSTVFARITLKVHSSLEAVGLTAAVSAALTEHQIPANVVAAFYHDHLFVPAERADEALDVLQALSSDALGTSQQANNGHTNNGHTNNGHTNNGQGENDGEATRHDR